MLSFKRVTFSSVSFNLIPSQSSSDIKKQTLSKGTARPLFIPCPPASIWGRALCESARRPCEGPATSHTGRWLWRSWPCWSPPRTLNTSCCLTDCCRAPLGPAAAPRGPASPAQSGRSALARKGCGTSAGGGACPSPVDAVDGDEDVGVRAGIFHIPGDDDDFILDGNQFADFAREALDGFITLISQELVLFGRQGDLCVTLEEISKQKGKFKVKSTPSTWYLTKQNVHLLVPQLLLCHHHLQNVPESFTLHLFTLFRYVADADAGDLPHVLGRELKCVGGTAVKGQRQVSATSRVCSWTVNS